MAREPTEARERSQRRAWIAERVWYGALSLVAVAVILASGAVVAASQPYTCNLCHASIARSAAAGSHKELTCEQCHAGRTGFDLMKSRLGVVNMVVYQLTPGSTRVAAEVDSRNCLVCHAEEMNKTVTVGSWRMNHRAPVAAGWDCQTCHPDVGHSGKAVSGGYTMDMCMSCHSSNPRNVATCDVCHASTSTGTAAYVPAGRSPWRVTHGSNWRKTHGMGDLAACKGCHTEGYCDQCHVGNVPHPPTYLQAHGQDVLSRPDERRACVVCHQQQSCDGCHGVVMPHPSTFIQVHGALSKQKGRQACLRCHVAGSCEECHARHLHPGIPAATIRELRAHPVKVP